MLKSLTQFFCSKNTNLTTSYLKCSKCNFSQVKRKYPLNQDYIKDMPINQYVISPHNRNRVYVWGNIRTGALGIPQKKEKENLHPVLHYKSPKRMHFAENNSIVHAATGFGFTLLATKSKVFGTGLNAESQIGYHEMRHDKPLELLFAPMNIHLDLFSAFNEQMSDNIDNNEAEIGKILKVSAGRGHSAVLTNKGLYLFGSNAYGQCGRKIIEDEVYCGSQTLNCVENIDGINIIDVVCGQDHTMAILENGSVYSCGWGADGQTGLGHYNSTDKFTKIEGDIAGAKIIKLACRSDFVLALNDKHEVFGWGNTEYSQMVLDDGSQQVANPTHLSVFNKIGKITSIATGGSFCLVLSESGEVFVWGFGLLGLGPLVEETKTPTIIPETLFGRNEFNSDSKVVSVQAGLSHMAAVTNKGDLYTWGRNRSCCLGLGFEKDQYFPLKVALGGAVKEVSCGLDHMIAICTSYIT